MNNKVLFAAAGNGKTYSICKQAKEIINNSDKFVLLLSYTNEGVHSLENEYKKQNLGVLDNRIVIKSWYRFLLSEFIKPYQCLLKLKYKCYESEYDITLPENFISAIAFYEKDPPTYYKKTHCQYYINKNNDIVANRTSQLAVLCNQDSDGKAISRIENIYSHIFIDELQDYAGWDLEIIKLLFQSQIEMLCVGDFKQATYRTNNSQKNKQYRDEKIKDFFVNLEKKRLCTISYSNATRRFNQEICNFINTIHNDKNAIVTSNSKLESEIKINHIGVYLIDVKYLKQYCNYYHPIILRYNKNTKIEFYHECDVFNYGAVKGATYDRIVIIPVSTILPFIEKQKYITSSQTRAKFYVACTRAKHSVIIAMNHPKESDVFKISSIKIGNDIIPAFKFFKCSK